MNPDALLAYREFSDKINDIFSGQLKALYAYGSGVYDDLHIGFSDLDFFAVACCAITEEHFAVLLAFRRELRASPNPLHGMLEGEFVPESLLTKREDEPVAYWGTSGERMKNRYDLSGFSMRGLLEKGVSPSQLTKRWPDRCAT